MKKTHFEQLKDIKAFGFSSSTEPILRKIRKSLNLIKLEKLDWKICSKWKSALLGVFAKFKIFREGQDTPNPGGVGVLYNQVHFACPNKLWICKYPKPCFGLCFFLSNWITKKWVLYFKVWTNLYMCDQTKQKCFVIHISENITFYHGDGSVWLFNWIKPQRRQKPFCHKGIFWLQTFTV